MSKNIAEMVKQLIEEPVNSCGVRLWDVEFVREGTVKYLRITIDKDEGISIDDCEKVHNLIDPLLDEADFISDQYNLEVTSPGIERNLKIPMHFLFCIGEEIELKLFAKAGDRKTFRGKLESFDEVKNEVTLDENGVRYTFALGDIAKVRTIFDFK